MNNLRAKAISIKYSAFVSASAGTGKTKTLIDRLLNLLLHQVKPHKILCLTFTKAASAEISSRINQKLAEFAICDRDILLNELKNLGFNKITEELEFKARVLFAEFVDNIEPLNIQTIHSFCQQLLAKFPFEANVNLNFILLDENKISAYIKQAKNILINQIHQYPEAKEAITYLSWHLKEYSLNELLVEIIANREKLDHFFESYDSLDQILEELAAIDEEKYLTDFIKLIPLKIENIKLLEEGGKTDLANSLELSKYISLSFRAQIIMFNDYVSCFLTQTDLLPRKFLLSKQLIEQYPDLYEMLANEQQRVYEFYQSFKEIKAINLTRSFIVISYYLRQLYQQLKQKNNSLDYNDLISLSDKLLSNSEYADWIRYKLDGGIDHILIDEAQDNSASQWQIIDKICEEFYYQSENKSLFIVGDAKQSIFSFQGADPALFSFKNKNLPESILRVSLKHSFRSGRQILHLVDRIFNQSHIKPLISEVETNIEHIAYKDLEGKIDLWPLIIEPEREEKKAWVLPSDLSSGITSLKGDEELAKKIAIEINKWLQEKKFIPSKNRIINPGDILILTRRRNDFVNFIIKELRNAKVPVMGVDRLKLAEHPIILDLIALSKFLLCLSDDFNLAIALKSPIFNFNEEQLFELCQNKITSLWDILQQQDLIIAETLSELGMLANTKSLFEFYFALIEYRNLRNIYEIYPEGDEILDAFLDLVLEFERDNISCLQLFLEFLNNNKTEIKRDIDSNEEQVRIITVHGAKGLQAPIVILVDTISLPSNDDSIIWLNKQKLIWPGKAKYYPEIAKKAKQRKNEAEYAEYLRLLYVALTRAEDELIITGVSSSDNISQKCWYSVVKEAL